MDTFPTQPLQRVTCSEEGRAENLPGSWAVSLQPSLFMPKEGLRSTFTPEDVLTVYRKQVLTKGRGVGVGVGAERVRNRAA